MNLNAREQSINRVLNYSMILNQIRRIVFQCRLLRHQALFLGYHLPKVASGNHLWYSGDCNLSVYAVVEDSVSSL